MSQNMTSGQNQQLMLKQLSYYCPGLHGKDTKQRIERRTFKNFLISPGETNRILIPLFQRRYCWERKRISGWWNDVLNGKRDHLGIHNSGNVVLKKTTEGDWLCIDGQQRTTTVSLLVASIRDALIKEEIIDQELKNQLETILYHKKVGKIEKIGAGDDLDFCRLLPSFADRKSFFQCITEGITGIRAVEDDDQVSLQLEAKRYFDTQIEKRLNCLADQSSENRVNELSSLTFLALEKMGLTLVEVLNEINLTQVFLWLQEKTLFGEGSFLFNPTPGIDFSSCDLVRNLILAAVMNDNMDEQEKFYRSKWLFPIESKFKNTEELSVFIGEFTEKKTGNSKTRHVSQLENTAINFRSKFAKSKHSFDHLMNYAKFYSYYEEKLRQSSMLPPVPMEKFKMAGKAEVKEETEVNFDNQVVYDVSMNLLMDIQHFVENKFKK